MRAFSVILLLIGLFTAGCASPLPNFRPSRPVEKASTLEDALKICDEYQIKTGEEDRSVSVGAMLPWARCIEDTFRYVPHSRENEPLAMLFHELSKIENTNLKNLDAKIVAPKEMNAAMRLSFKFIRFNAKQEISPRKFFTTAELAMIAVALPGFEPYLQSL